MNYRKLKKAYCRRFGIYIKITFKLKKTGRVAYKLSKKATARVLRKALYEDKPILGLIGKK